MLVRLHCFHSALATVNQPNVYPQKHIVLQVYILLRPTPYSQDNLAKLLQRDIFAKYNISAPLSSLNHHPTELLLSFSLRSATSYEGRIWHLQTSQPLPAACSCHSDPSKSPRALACADVLQCSGREFEAGC